MPEPENQFQTALGGEAEDLRNQLQSLRSLVSAALVLMIVFCVCVDLYLSPQVSEERARADQATVLMHNFNANAADFWTKLVDYSKKYPDFAPVIAKWSSHVVMSTNGPPPKPK